MCLRSCKVYNIPPLVKYMCMCVLIVLYCIRLSWAEFGHPKMCWSNSLMPRCSEWENSELGFSMIVSVGNVGLDHRPLQSALSTRWLHQSSRNYKGDSIIHDKVALFTRLISHLHPSCSLLPSNQTSTPPLPHLSFPLIWFFRDGK